MEKRELPKEVELIWKKAEDHRTFYVNAVYGGKTPHGDINIQLLRERSKLPDRQVREVTEGGEVKESEEEGRPTFVREVLGELYLTRENAFNIATWMLEKATPEETTKEEIKKILVKGLELSKVKGGT